MKNPWMKFYPADWRSDPALRSCTIAARGLWVEMLALMHEAEPYGSLLVNGQRIDKKRLGALAGVPERECVVLLLELEGVGVFSRDDDGTIYSRRMRRDAARSDEGKQSVRRKWGLPHQSANDKTRSERLSEARRKGRHADEEWAALVIVCGDKCVRCNDGQAKLVKDHIIPIYQGGSDGIDNLQPLCTKCNASKGPESEDHRPPDWEKRLGERLGIPEKTSTQKPEARSQKLDKKDTRDDALSSAFLPFWEEWPNKVGKPAALKAYAAAIKRGASAEEILNGVKNYVRNKPPDRPWLNPATFLNQNRWEDRPATVGTTNGKSGEISAACDGLLDKLNAGFGGTAPQEHSGGGTHEIDARLLAYGRG